MLTNIRNAGMAKHESLDVGSSKLKLEIARILKNEGYIKDFVKTTEDNLDSIHMTLRYDGENAHVIQGVKRLSKAGRRMYCGYEDMPRVRNGYGTVIVSTSLGVLTGKEAVKNKSGGELICEVW
jgi:small subunit ribosomal protein S8